MHHSEGPDIDQLRSERDVHALIEALSYGPDWAVRRDAALALGLVGDSNALGALRKAQDDTEQEVREAASKASGDIAVRLVDETSGGQTDQEQADARRISESYWDSL